MDAGPGGKAERYVPRAVLAWPRPRGSLAPRLVRRGAGAKTLTPETRA